MEQDDFEEMLFDWAEDDLLPPALDAKSEEFDPLSERIKTALTEAYASFDKEYRLPQAVPVENLWDKVNFPEVIHAIRSMVGDDEVITSNCFLYSVLCIIVGPLISRIIISWDDVQFHRHLYNYAEGWIFLPPSMDSGFESVSKYNRGNGVPFVLDPIKFKDLSPVRKQSNMNQDLTSKFRNLSERAAWTNPSWFTWNLHQFAMILGVEIFDFMRSTQFPYVFKSEGGCGGAPPWNNVFTAAAAIYRYRGGQAKVGILGVMDDANKLQVGDISPKKAFFTQNLNLALSGDQRWATIRSYVEREKWDAFRTGEEFIPLVSQEAEKTIPDELWEKSTAIEPDDLYTASAVSFLREKGHIFTEMDVVMRVEQERRLESVWGQIPMHEVEDQIELRKERYKESYLQVISELGRRQMDPEVHRRIKEIEDPFSPESIAVMVQYYRLRVEQASRISSMIYDEQIRVFKMADVETFYQKGVQGIKNQFSKSTGSRYRPESSRKQNFPDEQRTLDAIDDWLESGPLDKLLRQPIPPGCGPDDMRVVRNLNIAIQQSGNNDAFMCLIVTSDKGLVRAAQRVLTHNIGNSRPIRVVGLSGADYLNWALTKSKFVVRGKVQSVAWLRSAKLFNLVQGKDVPIQGKLLELLEQEAKMIWNRRDPKLLIEYDVPNINRFMQRFSLDSSFQLLRERAGGYLSATTVESDQLFVSRELEEIFGIPDFIRGYERSQYPLKPLNSMPVRLFSALRKGQVQGSSTTWRRI